jgi:predicted nucleic acid-binding protein
MQTITKEQGRTAIDELLALDVEIFPTTPRLCRSAYEWSDRIHQSRAYDAFYLALAEEIGAEFWTADRSLVNGAQREGATWTHWIGEGGVGPP